MQQIWTRLGQWVGEVLCFFALPLEVFWRHHMGERYLRFLWVHTFLVAAAISGSFAWGTIKDKPNDSADKTSDVVAQKIDRENELIRNTEALVVLQGLVYGFAALNFFEIRNKKKSGIRWHSQFRGVPRFLPDDHFSNQWLIPLGSLAVGLWLSLFFVGLGAYVIVCAIFQWFAFRKQVENDYNQFLDAQDRQIKNKQMRAILEGTNSLNAEGYSSPGLWKAAKTTNPDTVTKALSESDLAERFRDVLSTPNR